MRQVLAKQAGFRDLAAWKVADPVVIPTELVPAFYIIPTLADYIHLYWITFYFLLLITRVNNCVLTIFNAKLHNNVVKKIYTIFPNYNFVSMTTQNVRHLNPRW